MGIPRGAIPRGVLAAAGCAALAAAAGAARAEPDVTVVRGAEVERVDPSKNRAPLAPEVTVLRGAGAKVEAAAAPAPAPAAVPTARWQVIGGEKIWLLDREGGHLIACNLRGSLTVGRREIRCWQRPF